MGKTTGNDGESNKHVQEQSASALALLSNVYAGLEFQYRTM